MSDNIWHSSSYAAEYLDTDEKRLSYLRVNGFFKPGIHWKSSPYGQRKPWNPEVLYNIELCKTIINKYYSEEQFEPEVA